jgi:putative peptidoglycan lipid II flippase
VGVLVRGNFTHGDARVAADTLQMMALGLLPFSVYLYVLRGFYAMQDTRTPFVVNTFENALNVVLALILFAPLRVQGLGLAWAGAYTFAAAVTLVWFGWRLRTLGGVPRRGAVYGRPLLSLTAKAALGSVALGVVAAPIAGAVGSNTSIDAAAAALLAALAGGAVYVVVLRTLRVSEIRIWDFRRSAASEPVARV